MNTNEETNNVQFKRERERSKVNFINVPQAAFTCTDLESSKKTVRLSVFFALWGSASARLLVDEIDP